MPRCSAWFRPRGLARAGSWFSLLGLVVAFTCCAPGPAQSPTGSRPDAASRSTSQKDRTMVKVRVFDSSGQLIGPVEMLKVVKTDAEWGAQLTPAQFEIARGKGTERPFCGTLLDNKKDGVYACVCCRLPLFRSANKFNSGTGWPSFFQAIAPENVVEHSDVSHGMVRTEILCARCDCHLGHVFDDGPPPTGMRHCVNSESLVFVDQKDLKSLAEPPASRPAGQRATAVFAGGCFWCVEAVFEELDGVIEAISGYAGGSKDTANYEDVCTGTTGHAESVQIVYDPTRISYEELLRVHFATHDPTTLNRQGADVGTQYRSAIFYSNEQEKKLAQAFLDDLRDQKVFGKPVVTTLEPLTGFYPAESHHQNFVCNNPMQSYVRAVALPKVEKVRKQFKDALKSRSPLAR